MHLGHKLMAAAAVILVASACNTSFDPDMARAELVHQCGVHIPVPPRYAGIASPTAADKQAEITALCSLETLEAADPAVLNAASVRVADLAAERNAILEILR